MNAKACTILCNSNGDTPMHLAVKFGQAEVVQLLMKSKRTKVPTQKSADAQVMKKPKKGFSTPTHSLHLPDDTLDFHKSTPCLAVPKDFRESRESRESREFQGSQTQKDPKNSSLNDLSMGIFPPMKTTPILWNKPPTISGAPNGAYRESRRSSLDHTKCTLL